MVVGADPRFPSLPVLSLQPSICSPYISFYHVLVQGPSPPHYLLGLKILNMLVSEMNNPTPGRSLTQHRKIAVSFRDLSLYKVGPGHKYYTSIMSIIDMFTATLAQLERMNGPVALQGVPRPQLQILVLCLLQP